MTTRTEGAGTRPRYDSMRSHSSIGQGWARPASPTFSTTTTGSKVNLPPSHALITRKDLRASILCFEELMSAAKAYRNALLAMSSATAAFANAMEACSRVKGCRSSNSAVAGASGLQYLVSNHEQVLADAVYRHFEIPLLEALDHYKLVTADRLVMYEKALTEQSARIRKTEAENLKNARRRKRGKFTLCLTAGNTLTVSDLTSFRQALADLQRQVDELDAIKAGYHEEVLEGEDDVWDTVLNKIAFVVRSQLDFYEKIAGKASDPILEPLVMSVPDPFDSYGPPKEDGQIFSVLAPLGMLDSTPQSPNPNLTRTGSSISTPERSSSPIKGIPFPASAATPARAETSTVSAQGVNGLWDDEDQKDLAGRARRELSVIEESSSIAQKEDGDALLDGGEDDQEGDEETVAAETPGVEADGGNDEPSEGVDLDVRDPEVGLDIGARQEAEGAQGEELPKPSVISVTT